MTLGSGEATPGGVACEVTNQERSLMKSAFVYETLASPLQDVHQLRLLMAPIDERLQLLGGRPGSATVRPDIPFLIVVATGGTESLVLDRVKARRALVEDPTILAVRDTDNSLPAALEVLARLQQDGGRGRIVSAVRGDDLELAVADQVAFLAMRTMRLGVVGEPSDWLVASNPSAETVASRWGPALVALSTESMLAGSAGEHATAVAVELGQRWSEQSTKGDVAPREVEKAALVHQPLVDLITDQDLDGITVRCFDLLSANSTSGCVALAELNDAGVVAGCEGDIVSATAMMWVRELLDATSWMANPSSVDAASGEILLAHCTIAPSLVEDYALETHFESGLGVGVAGRFADQPVTLIRLGGKDMELAWLVDGELSAGQARGHLCRTQATITVEPARAGELLSHPLGNHLLLIPGHHAERLRTWWDLYIADA